VEATIHELLKYGAPGIGLIIAAAFLYGLFKFVKIVLPVALAFKPSDTNGDKGGQLFTVLTKVAGLASDIEALTTEIKNFIKVIEDHVPTKADFLAQFEKVRHDVRDIVGEGT
jgi:hypothetical protein